MLITAEIRWFWPSEPNDLAAWFHDATSHGTTVGGGSIRTDMYLRDAGQVELGLKHRGGKPGVEIKGLVAVSWAGLTVPPFAGPIDLWTKWTSEPLALAPDRVVAIEKQRWLRTFDTSGWRPEEITLDANETPVDGRPLPTLGCNVELTRIRLGDEVWWTLGLEAYGTLHTVEHQLRAVAATLATRDPPPRLAGQCVSYPAWLRDRLATR